VVLGFPSNDFNQEDADSKKTAELCFNTYGVKFPMFSAVGREGRGAQPAVRGTLAKSTGKAPSWNFNKYLVNRQWPGAGALRQPGRAGQRRARHGHREGAGRALSGAPTSATR
jgi:hypothetical protein